MFFSTRATKNCPENNVFFYKLHIKIRADFLLKTPPQKCKIYADFAFFAKTLKMPLNDFGVPGIWGKINSAFLKVFNF